MPKKDYWGIIKTITPEKRQLRNSNFAKGDIVVLKKDSYLKPRGTKAVVVSGHGCSQMDISWNVSVIKTSDDVFDPEIHKELMKQLSYGVDPSSFELIRK